LARIAVLLALLFVPQALASQTHATAGHLPTRGVFVPGVSLVGVKLGMSQTQVKTVLGGNYSQCTVAVTLLCKEPAWLFTYTRGEPLGVAVKFHNLKVSAVFTLGAIAGWKTSDGLKMGDPAASIYNFYQTPIYTRCVGFEALSMRKGTVTTSFYTSSGIVYGFALTTPPEGVCQ
jgi:hypothetical protein